MDPALVVCPSCNTSNETTAKFCNQCGQHLSSACGVCGTANPASARFCNQCANPFQTDAAAPRPAPAASAPAATAVAERRLVSVLFADLVGFTTISESRDAEETRDLLTRYFEVARGVIERHGGQWRSSSATR